MYSFVQSNNETTLDIETIDNPRLITSAILSENLQEVPYFGYTSIAFVTIPASVTTTGAWTFSSRPLTSVTFAKNSQLQRIDDDAFNETPLASITIPDSVTYLSGFYKTLLTSVTIPDSVTTIGDDAFRYCVKLTSVIIPDSVTTIGSDAFRGCVKLTSVIIPDSVTTIGSDAFQNSPIQSIGINCNTPSRNNIIVTLDNMITAKCTAGNVNTLQVALSASLLAAKNPGEIKDYVLGILSIASPTSNAIISAIAGKQEKLFELDLSNTDLVQADINEMAKTLPWTVVFKNGDRVTYES
jgi:hypothetical protein